MISGFVCWEDQENVDKNCISGIQGLLYFSHKINLSFDWRITSIDNFHFIKIRNSTCIFLASFIATYLRIFDDIRSEIMHEFYHERKVLIKKNLKNFE